MSTQVFVELKEISCRNIADGTDTIPYIWPMLLWIDSNGVHSAFPPLDIFRESFWSAATRGQTAAIPANVGVLRGTIDDIDNLRAILLVVPLLQQSNSSDDMMRAAFAAYCTELPLAVSQHLLGLADSDTRGEALNAIKQQVKRKVADAAQGQLGTLGEIGAFLGNDDFDTILDVAVMQSNITNFEPIFLGFAGTQLQSYADNGAPGNVSDPTTVSHDAWGWFKFVFGSTHGVYAVDPKGQLLWYADDGTPNNIPDPVVVGFGGWSDFKLVFAGANRIYAVDQKGQLLSYSDNGQPGNVSDPVVVGFGGWSDFKYLFAAGSRVYAVDQKGQLLSYSDNGQPGNVSDPVLVGFDGWKDLKKVFGGGERIYALQDTSTPSTAYRIQGQLQVLLTSRHIPLDHHEIREAATATATAASHSGKEELQ
jgi:hypothetical protein